MKKTRSVYLNKNQLKEIAKRFAKSVLFDSANTAFWDSGLSEDNQDFIKKYMEVLGNRITHLDSSNDTHSLIKEYLNN